MVYIPSPSIDHYNYVQLIDIYWNIYIVKYTTLYIVQYTASMNVRTP